MSVRCYGCMNLKENSSVCEHCGYDERRQNNTHQLPAGTEVGGQYILGRVLGQGGFGITYIGWDKIMNQRVAVKEYFPSGYAGRDTLRTLLVTSYDNQNAHAFEANKRRFLREAESLARLWNIPQIVKVLRHFEENGTAYIAMEYAEGMDLRKYMKRRGKPLSMEELMEILGPVIQALEFVHKADLVHRDISPDNIMVLPDGSTKLLDFGAARYVENADAEKDRNTSTQAILKHGFAPPEQYRSHGALGPWTDVYAMCATVYFCLTGRIPTEAMARVMEDLEVGWDKVPGLTEQQRSALDQGMALKPKVRIQSAGELYQKLFGEILEAREKARQEEAEEQRRQEEERKRQEARKAEEARRAEEARLKEEARKAEQQRRKEAAAEKERLRKEAEEKRLEEKRRREQARKAKKQGRGKPVLAILAAVLAVAVAVAVFLRKPAGAPAEQEMAVRPTESLFAETEAVPVTETVQQEETTRPTLPPDAWKNNVLMGHRGRPSGDLDSWYEANKDNPRYTDCRSVGSFVGFSLSTGETVSLTPEGYLAYLGSIPAFGSNIPRGKILEVIFLDTVENAPGDAWDVSANRSGTVLAWTDPAGEDMYTLYLAGEGGINGSTNCGYLFFGFVNLRSVRFDGHYHTEIATEMSEMFYNCTALQSLDLSSFDTSSVTNMAGMFSGCTSLTSVDLSSFDTSNVTSMNAMFRKCSSLRMLDLSGFDTSSVENMGGMFNTCASLTSLDLSGFDTSSVTSMNAMFLDCFALTELDVSSFDTSGVTDMSSMFLRCSGLTELDLNHFDTRLVEDMSFMFYDCRSLEVLHTGFDTSSLKKSDGIFDGCHKLPDSYKHL